MVVNLSARWNHNIHYYRRILDAVPASARNALDVGTGNGLLAAALRERVPSVTGIDIDAAVLEYARAETDRVTWLQGDALTYPFRPASFDVVASVATIHHMPDLESTLARLAELTVPGGVIAVVGLARSTRPIDFVYDLAGLVEQRRYRRLASSWEHSAPVVWPPPHSYADVRRAAARVLPGARWTRLALWRYSLIWTKPSL
ncbi:bifunctional 2-polyprenyl-6-hydroxyphenol methylase/3-demethylubiquinol 3-O-methyltransferase UbiG [Salinibacterium sp. SWN248]|uniref:class I SAM-dependent methyltransferase n=1 Tax=Salinibacterium sp. SWN248 TaxID=2792056 RepID=UPI0018CD045A|nr:class I SAM-dependent methyltransferase [Salinibacterium sp. SWN248]MBH0022976.1 class I SAM-dependent methyltransferase [Salinibacterium sp. SWN248]